jgi:hypothetical protein
MPRLELLVADLRMLSKKIGAPTSESLVTADNLLALPRYLDFPYDEERRTALIADLVQAVESLPADERSYARLLLSYEAAGTNITHRRKLAGMDSKPSVVAKWRELYVMALVASRLLELAGRSALDDTGPGYRHDLITYRTTMRPDNPSQMSLEWIYDVRIVRDGTYIYLIGESTPDAGKVIDPWKVISGQEHAGDVPFDPAASDGTMLHVIYLGRRYMSGEPVRIVTTETRLYPGVDEQNCAGVHTGRFASPLLIEVDCPLRLCRSYERIEYEGNSVDDPPRSKKAIARKSDATMKYRIAETVPRTRYSLNWTMVSNP